MADGDQWFQNKETVFIAGNCPKPALNMHCPNIALNGNLCKVNSSTRYLVIQIDDILIFREKTEQSMAKARTIWNLIACKRTRKYSLSITTQVILYKTIVLLQLLDGAPIKYHKNVVKLRIFRSSVIGCIFKHGSSLSIQASQAPIGQPPEDILCERKVCCRQNCN